MSFFFFFFLSNFQDSLNVVFESALSFVEDQRVTPLLDFQERVSGQLGIGLQKDSELKAIFDYQLIRLKEVFFLQLSE